MVSCWQDFAHYKSGVYKHLYGDPIGGHAVKLIGWGTTDDGVDYWVCQCSVVSVLASYLYMLEFPSLLGNESCVMIIY